MDGMKEDTERAGASLYTALGGRSCFSQSGACRVRGAGRHVTLGSSKELPRPCLFPLLPSRHTMNSLRNTLRSTPARHLSRAYSFGFGDAASNPVVRDALVPIVIEQTVGRPSPLRVPA